MIANWLVSMKTTRLFLFFFFCGAEELNYQETNKRKAANMWIRMFLRSICDYSCRARQLSCSVFAVSTRCSQTAALMWDGPGIHSFTTPAHVICFVKCAGTSGILIILRLVLSPSDEAGGKKKTLNLILSEASPERCVYLGSLVHKSAFPIGLNALRRRDLTHRTILRVDKCHKPDPGLWAGGWGLSRQTA